MVDPAGRLRVLVVGAGGQIGRALVEAAPASMLVRGLSRSELDIEVADDVAAMLRDWRPDVLVNAAAYTDVDGAEVHPDWAYAINAAAPCRLAAAASCVGVRMVHLSSDFVFDGAARLPYRPNTPTSPLGIYGASKAAGEHAVRAVMPDALIVRTAWIYAARGRNFVLTMLRLMSAAAPVRVVADQIGTPTHARSVARGLWGLVRKGAAGTCHLTDDGVASWYDLAVTIGWMAYTRGLLARPPVVIPICTADFATVARRPAFSVLDCAATWPQLGYQPPTWDSELAVMLDEVSAARTMAVRAG